jgi:hypothetical protein
MAQYKTGSVKVVSGEAAVVGTGTLWAANVEVADSFKMKSESVIYQVGIVTDDTHISLSTLYNGTTRSGEQYQITRDFTPNLKLPEVSPGDIDWPDNVTKALRTIDGRIVQTIMSGEVAPVLSGETGTKGEMRFSGTYLYVCTATNYWRRVALGW